MKCGLSDRFEAFVETPWNLPYAHCPYAQGMAEIRCFGSTLCATADKTKCFGTVWIFSFYSNLVENPCWRSYVLKLLFWNHLIEERSLEHEALPKVWCRCAEKVTAVSLITAHPTVVKPAVGDRSVSFLKYWGQFFFILKEAQNLLLVSCPLFKRSEPILAWRLSSDTNEIRIVIKLIIINY